GFNLLSLILDNAIRHNQGAPSAFGQRHDATYSRVPKLCTLTGGIAACCAAPRERPRSGRAAEKRNELAALHSITSSARSRNDTGIGSGLIPESGQTAEVSMGDLQLESCSFAGA